MIVTTLVPIVKIHPITKQEDGIETAIININMANIKKVIKDENDGTTIICYADGSKEQILVEFIKFMDFMNRLKILDFSFIQEVTDNDIELRAWKDSLPVVGSSNPHYTNYRE